MGCMSSTQASAPLPAGLQAATREYFRLGELPLTLKAIAKGSVLEVKAAGLDRDDLLTVLEAGFYSRGYWISEATVHVDSGLFIATFELRESMFASEYDEDVSVAGQSTCVDVLELGAPSGQFEDSPLKLVSDEQFSEALGQVKVPSPSKHFVVAAHEKRQLEAADRRARRRGAAVRLTLMQDWAPGLRLSLEKTIRAAGFCMIMARFSMARHSTTPIIKDTLWLSQSLKEEFGRGCSLDISSLPQWLLNLRKTLQATNPLASMVSDPVPAGIPLLTGIPAPADVELQVKQMAMSEREQHLMLPGALQAKASKLHYRLEPAPWGLQVSGQEKFCGSGIAVSHAGKHVLEFATYFARARSSSELATPINLNKLSFASMVNVLKDREVGEFVTQYSPPSNTLTIQKVFLNGVLPPGQRMGARLAAEQLLHMPVKGDPKWDGLEAIRNLRKIHLFDVVNWNTYAIMSWASEAPSSIKRTETEKLLLREEAKACGLTLAEVSSKPLDKVFARTALGKLVQSMLQVWRASQAADYEIEKVRVRFSNQHELILGEFRSMMEIDVDLGEGPGHLPQAS